MGKDDCPSADDDCDEEDDDDGDDDYRRPAEDIIVWNLIGVIHY